MEKEKWEIDLRAKLESKLEDGYYQFEGNGYVFGTGKQGAITFKVKEEKYRRGLLSGIEEQIQDNELNKIYTDIASEDDFINFCKLLSEHKPK